MDRDVDAMSDTPDASLAELDADVAVADADEKFSSVGRLEVPSVDSHSASGSGIGSGSGSGSPMASVDVAETRITSWSDADIASSSDSLGITPA